MKGFGKIGFVFGSVIKSRIDLIESIISLCGMQHLIVDALNVKISNEFLT